MLKCVLILCWAAAASRTGRFGLALTLHVPAAAQHEQRLRRRLNDLDRAARAFVLTAADDPAGPELSAGLADACLDVCRALPPPSRGSTPTTNDIDIQYAEARAQARRQEQTDRLRRHFFDAQLPGTLLRALASATETEAAPTSTSSSPDDDRAVVDRRRRRRAMTEVADAVAASARFALLPDDAALRVADALDAAVADPNFLALRKNALLRLRRTGRAASKSDGALEDGDPDDALTDAAVAAQDCDVLEALYACVLGTVLHATAAAAALTPGMDPANGAFPRTALGLEAFCAAVRLATGTQRAAAALSRVWHAAEEAGPLIHAADSGRRARLRGRSRDNCNSTLVVAFSSLGWSGVVRPEWGATLRRGGGGGAADCPTADGDNDNVVDVVHAFDSCRSWYSSDPATGACDDGAWWDAALAALAEGYGRVCLVGDSMGGTAALRYARHAKNGTVVAFVPQIDLGDFVFDVRHDLDAERQERLRAGIQRAVSTTSARVVIHVGRDMDDLHQLTYLKEAVSEHAALGLHVDDPLPRDGSTTSHAVGSRRLQVVKHDVEGHAIGVGLKAQGLLREIVIGDLFGSRSWADSL